MKITEFGVQELSQEEMKNANGGLIWFAAIPLAKIAAAGFAAGVVIGGIVLARILGDKECEC